MESLKLWQKFTVHLLGGDRSHRILPFNQTSSNAGPSEIVLITMNYNTGLLLNLRLKFQVISRPFG